MTIVIEISASVSLTVLDKPHSSNTGETYSPRRSAPKAAERNPRKVIPTWAAAKNLFGFLVSATTRSPRLLFPSSWRIWDSRSEISAISAATKNPAIPIKRRTRPISRRI